MRRFTATVLVLVALLAPIVAAANVPDPAWIPGMYDGGDADEILGLVWDGTPALTSEAPALLEPHAVVSAPPSPVVPAPPRCTRAAVSRAPPLV
jgi:hypothetical protein